MYVQTVSLFTIEKYLMHIKSCDKQWCAYNQTWIKVHWLYFDQAPFWCQHNNTFPPTVLLLFSLNTFAKLNWILFFPHRYTKIYEISRFFSQLTVVHSSRKQHRIFKEGETILLARERGGGCFCLIWYLLPVLLLLSMMILVVRRPVWVRPFCLLGVRNRSLLR